MRSSAWYDPNYEKRITKIAKNYIGKYGFGYFLFDFLACVPVLLYEAAHGFTTDYEEKYEQIHSNQYITYVWFKIFKILMLARIHVLTDAAEFVVYLRCSQCSTHAQIRPSLGRRSEQEPEPEAGAEQGGIC